MPSDVDKGTSASIALPSENALESYLQKLEEPLNNCSTHNVKNDLILYERQCRLPITENILKFWDKKCDCLSMVAKVVLGIPCTQVSVERLFSALKYILADQRNRLYCTNLEHISLVKANGVFEYEGF